MKSVLKILAALILLISCKSHDLCGIYTAGANTVKIYQDSLIYIDIADKVWSDNYPRTRLLLSGELSLMGPKNYQISPKIWILDSLDMTELKVIDAADSIEILLKDPNALSGVFKVATDSFRLWGVEGNTDLSLGINDDFNLLMKGAGEGYPIKIKAEILRDTNGWWEGALFRMTSAPNELVLLSVYHRYILIKADEIKGYRLEIKDDRIPMHTRIYGSILVKIKPKRKKIILKFKGGRVKLNRVI